MRLSEFKNDAERNVAKRSNQQVDEILPAIAGLAARTIGGAALRGGAALAKSAARGVAKGVAKGVAGTGRAAGSAVRSATASAARGPNATVGTQSSGSATAATSTPVSSIANKAAAKATQQVAQKLIRRGGQIPLPTADNQVQQYKVDNVKGDDVTLIDPKATNKPGQPDKVVVSRKDIEPVIQGMMSKQ
jgi:hypothetical protein